MHNFVKSHCWREIQYSNVRSKTAQAGHIQIGLTSTRLSQIHTTFHSKEGYKVVIYSVELHDCCMLWVGVYLVCIHNDILDICSVGPLVNSVVHNFHHK